MIHAYRGKTPRTDKAALVAWNAEVVGDVELGEDSSIWYGAVARGDIDKVIVGDRSNIQDNAVLHLETGSPCIIGDDVTVGHGAIIHGCTVGDGCLVGMGATILNRAVLGNECVVGAGALVTEGKEFPPRSLIVGIPAKAIREVTEEELEAIRANTARYVLRAKEHAADVKENFPSGN